MKFRFVVESSNSQTGASGQEPTFASDWYSAAFNGIGDVEEVANYLRAFKLVQGHPRNPSGLPISVRLLNNAAPIIDGRSPWFGQAAK